MQTLVPVRILPVLLLLLPSLLKAQFPLDPYRVGNGNNLVFSTSPWSAGFGNVAAMDTSFRYNVAFYGSRPFLLKELSETGATVNLHWLAKTNLSLAFAVKGYSLFRRSFLSGGLARDFGKGFRAGVRFEWYSTVQGENYGSSHWMMCSSGLLIRLSHLVEAGTAFTIPVNKQSVVNNGYFSSGLRFRFSEIFCVMAESSVLGKVMEFRGAFSYHMHPRVEVTGGLGGKPLSLSFGLNLTMKNFNLYMAAVHRPLSGFSPVAGISVGGQ